MAHSPGSFIFRYSVAIISVALAIWARLLFDPVLGLQFPFATVFLAVLITAWYGGFRPALVALVLGAIGSRYFLIPPRGSLGMTSFEQQMGLALYIFTGLGISLLAGSMHAARVEAESTAESVRRQAALIDQTYDAVLVWDWNGPITFWNRGAERLYGYSYQEVLGRLSHELLHTERQDGLIELRNQLEKEGFWEGELKQTTRDGQQITVETRMVLVRRAGEVYVLETDRDITRRKHIEAELLAAKDQLEIRVDQRTAELTQAHELLQASEERFRLLIEGVKEYAIFMLDPAGHVMTWNSGAERHTGYQAEEIIGRHFACFYCEDDIAKARPEYTLEKVLADGRCEDEGWRVRKDGSRFWARVVITPLYDTSGRLRGFAKVACDITEQKMKDEALQDRERLLSIVTDSARVGLVVVGPGYRYLFANKAYAEILGLETHEIVGRRVPEMLAPAWSQIQPRLDRAFSGEQVTYELMMPPLPGNQMVRYFTVVYEPGITDSGLPTVVVVVINITDRKRADEELRVSEERFRQLAENIREVFWLSDLVNKQVLYVSPAYKLVWGRTCQSLYDSPTDWLEAIHPEDRDRVEQQFLVQAVGKYDVEYRIIRPDGSLRWIHDRGFPIADRDGKIYRIAGVAEDITERRQAETVSQQQQEQLEGIVNSAMDGIITINEDQQIILINAAAERMFGCRAGEALGKGIDLFIPERFRAAHAGHVRQFGLTGIAARAMGLYGRISGLRSDGEEFPIEASISQIQVEGRKLFTVTCRDVTERVRTAAEKQKLEAQLHQSQKMEAFGQLAGGVAHDFNNLLTVISGYSELLLTMLPGYDSRRAMVIEIRDAGERAATLTRQLLAFSRQQVLEPKVLDLNTIVTDTEKMLRRLIGEDVEFSTVLRPNISPVKVDPGQIIQVILNLAVNARDAMPQGGKLTIETSDIELSESYLKLHPDAQPGQFVMLAISDNGSGMAPEIKNRIFEPFFTTKGVGKGTGLGLAVVHGIVKQSGGNIDLYSEVGVGTAFKIFLPAVQERPESRLDTGLPGSLRGKETILLVEDEDIVRNITSFSLEEFGYTILTAPDGKTALKILAHHEGKIDLLITDVVMPEMSGRELAETLLSQNSKLKVLFMSGYTDDAIVRHGVLQAHVAFLQKPFTPTSLAKKVREVLDHDQVTNK